MDDKYNVTKLLDYLRSIGFIVIVLKFTNQQDKSTILLSCPQGFAVAIYDYTADKPNNELTYRNVQLQAHEINPEVVFDETVEQRIANFAERTGG